MRKKLITLTLLAFAANVANGAKIQTNQLIHSDDFNKNWKTITISDEMIQQQNNFKSCRIFRTSKFMDENKESNVLWKGSCSDFMERFGSTESNKPIKGWTSVISKDYDGITLEIQQQNHFANCRGVKRNEDQSVDILWKGSCVEFMIMKYKGTGTKFAKGWTTLFVSHVNVQKNDRFWSHRSYRIVDSVSDDSVGAVWTAPYNEVLEEIKTRTRFKNKKYASFLHKQIQKHLHLPQLK
jgi:hypothetical protein